VLKTGDILLVEFPYTDGSGIKRRPVVLIDRFGGDLLVAYFTREVEKYAGEPTSVAISRRDISEGSIKSTSVIRLHKLAIVNERLCKWVARIRKGKIDEILRIFATIAAKVHFESVHKTPLSFIPGKSRINYAGRVYDEKEITSLIDSALDFWLTAGRFEKEFTSKLSDFLGIKHVITTNSGSSANLLAISALTSPKLGDRRLKPGDEVITVAAGFPTTVAPIVQNRLIPVFVDIELGTYNIDVSQLEAAFSSKTRAVFLAHTLGIPFDVDEVLRFCHKHDLWLIEDNCDALGAKYTSRLTLHDSRLTLHDSRNTPAPLVTWLL